MRTPRAHPCRAHFRICNVQSAVSRRPASIPGIRRSGRRGRDNRGRPRTHSRDNSCSADRTPDRRLEGQPPLSASRAAAAAATHGMVWMGNRSWTSHADPCLWTFGASSLHVRKLQTWYSGPFARSVQTKPPPHAIALGRAALGAQNVNYSLLQGSADLRRDVPGRQRRCFRRAPYVPCAQNSPLALASSASRRQNRRRC